MPNLEILNEVDHENIRKRTGHGVIIAIIAEPTVNEQGVGALGGVGESYLGDSLSGIFQTETIGFGRASRELANSLAGRELDEIEFEAWRKGLKQRKVIHLRKWRIWVNY